MVGSLTMPRDAQALTQPSASHLPPGAQAIEALTRDACRWPIGEVSDWDFHFCGEPRGRGAYCLMHRALSRGRGDR